MLVKLLPIAMIGLLAVMMALTIFTATRSITYSFFWSLLIVLYPVSTDQTFYVIGTHPTFGVALGLLSLNLFWLGWLSRGIREFSLLASSALVALAAALSSPMLTLATVAPPAWLILLALMRQRDIRPRELLARLALVSLPLAFHLHRGMFRNVYTEGGDSRINISADNILPSLVNVAKAMLRPWEDQMFLVAGLSIVAVAAILTAIGLFRAGRGDAVIPANQEALSYAMTIALMAIVLGALAYGPNVAVEPRYARTRYVVAPLVCVAVAMALVIWYLAQRKGTKAPWYLAGGFAALAVATSVLFALQAHTLRNELYAKYLLSFQKVSDVVRREARHWPDNAQLLFAVPPGTAIYSWRRPPWNIWSTRSLRLLSGKPHIVATFAATDWLRTAASISPSPWAGTTTAAAISTSLAAIDLSANAPLYAYTWDGAESSRFVRRPLAYFIGEEASLVRRGKPAIAATPADLSLFDASCAPVEEPYLYSGLMVDRLAPPSLSTIAPPASWSFDGQSLAVETVAIEPGQRFLLSFTIAASGPVPPEHSFSRTYPPMPMRGPALSIYQRERKLDIVINAPAPLRWSVSDNGVHEITLSGREGCRSALLVDGQMVGVVDGMTVGGRWVLGRGIQERYWNGRIEDWRVLVEGEKQ
jgi:hypothetical protein